MPEKTVLLIDDNLMFVDKLKHATAAAGYAARPVMFASALEPALEPGTPAAILVNLDADRMDALALVRDLRARQGFGAVPIIAFCGHVHADLMAQGRDAGATEVVSNGAIASLLPRLLRNHVEGGGPDEDDTLEMHHVQGG